jgi:hypothetical protein
MPAVEGSASGHPSIRATHAKTLELIREDEITERATCVVGVAASLDEEAIGALRGRVELTIAAGGESATVRGRVNPAFWPGDPLVVRRAGAVTRDAVVIGADAAASDLDRALVERLAVAGAEVEVRFVSLDEPSPGALIVGLTGASGEPFEIERHIDALSRTHGDFQVSSPLGEADAARALEALGRGSRVSLTASIDADCAAADLIAKAHEAGHDVLPAPRLDPIDAVAAVAGVPAADRAVFDAREERPRDVGWDEVGCAAIENVPADRIEKWLRPAARAGAWRGAIGLDIGTPREQYLPWRPGEPVEIPGARGRTAVLVLMVASRVEAEPL